ncbi:ABC transporter substrate-binding protein [Streptomyces chartreusis]|uniref:ABC transporter substrate-binding protein n=1 Tax=Streptomyces chartreusis TaxID=1969 RepID=UPI00342A10FB
MQRYPGVDHGAKARFERANREGGVAGRKIDFLGVQDDSSDLQRNTSLVKSLVQQRDVFAVVPLASDRFGAASSQFLSKSHVPYVGWGVTSGFCGSQWGFGYTGCHANDGLADLSGIEGVLAATGKRPPQLKVALQTDAGAEGKAAAYAEVLEQRGADIVYIKSDLSANGVTSYAPWAEALIETDPDVIYTLVDFPHEVGLSGALRTAGYDGMIVGSTSYVPGVLTRQPNVAAALDELYISTPTPVQEENSPAIEQIQEDLAIIGEPTEVGLGVSLGYWQADVFVSMLESVEGELTSDSLQKAVVSGFSYKSEEAGGIGPLTFPKNLTAPVTCAGLVQVEGTKYVVRRPFTCYDSYPAD